MFVSVKRSELSRYFAGIGRKGARKRAKSLTPERRSEIAKKAAAARWGQATEKRRGKPKK